MKTIIIFYSRAGKTKVVAETIRQKFYPVPACRNGVICDIVEVKDRKDRSGISGCIGACCDSIFRKTTETDPKTFDFKDYDLIFLGTPVWVFNPPPAILSFIDNCNFTNKKVILFITANAVFGNTEKILTKKITSSGGQVTQTILIRTALKSKEKIAKESGRNLKMVVVNP